MKIHLVTDKNLAGEAMRLFKSERMHGKSVRLSYGGKTIPVSVSSDMSRRLQETGMSGDRPISLVESSQVHQGQDDAVSTSFVRISPLVKSVLRLPDETHLCAQQSETEWTLGPCLGFYSQGEASPERPFGEQTKMFTDLSRLGAEKGVDVVVLTPGYRQFHQGWRWNSRLRRWVRTAIPEPDVIIRRSGTFSQPALHRVAQDLASFRASGKLHSLPRVCGNKWVLYQTLRTDPELVGRFPATEVANSADEVFRILLSKGNVYVKPLAGAQGVQIYHLFVRGHNVVAQWQRKSAVRSGKRDLGKNSFHSQVVTEVLSGQAEFTRFWQRTKLRRCLVQDTVLLPRTRLGQPFDFRWLVQDCQEQAVLARVARVGQVNAVTTNIHTGARALPADQALLSAGWTETETELVIQQLDDVALRVARTLQQKYGRFAEVGIDMALRSDGKIFVFEANPTPGRRMLRSLPGDVREMSLVRLLEYAMRASGFERESSE